MATAERCGAPDRHQIIARALANTEVERRSIGNTKSRRYTTPSSMTNADRQLSEACKEAPCLSEAERGCNTSKQQRTKS